MDDISTVLAERNATHGSFASNTLLSQHMKALFRSAPGWSGMTDLQREAGRLHCVENVSYSQRSK
jgi:hypothetical protein